MLVLGGGSNLVVADAGFAGTVVEVATRGVRADVDGDDPTCGGADGHGRGGRELGRRSWPGRSSAGGSASRRWPASRAWSARPRSRTSAPTARRSRRPSPGCGSGTASSRASRTFANADCGFGYRTSRFKADPDRHVVLDVTFQLRQGGLGAPVQYAELARALGVELGAARPARPTCATPCSSCAASKGMVLDAADHDTWSAGSFFTNPVVDAAAVPAGAPAWPQPDGRVKTSAAWLIEHAGFPRATAPARSACPPSTPSRSPTAAAPPPRSCWPWPARSATGSRRRYGIGLVNEPVLVGCELLSRRSAAVGGWSVEAAVDGDDDDAPRPR